jgi:GNAT superfamily N-acetyltransferase
MWPMSGRDEVAVRPVLDDDDEQAFRDLPRRVMRDIPHWRPVPNSREIGAFDPDANPLLQRGDVVRYLAERSDQVVGRIAAWTDPRAPDGLGMFGFYDAVDDLQAGRALLWAACDWCRSRGCTRIRGPIDFWSVWSTGSLVGGEDRPVVIGLHHGRDYYVEHFEAANACEVAELYAWSIAGQPVPLAVKQIGEAVLARNDVEVRNFEPDSDRDWQLVTELYREAYVDDEWYFDLTTDELRLMAGDDVDPDISAIVFVGGEPAAMSIGLRNTAENALRIGAVVPPDPVQRVWRAGQLHCDSWRQWLFAIAAPFRGRAVGGLGTALFVWLRQAAQSAGYSDGELAWTPASAEALTSRMHLLGATHDRTYRVFECALSKQNAQKWGSSASD